ncbi:MAG TPA: sulfatase-like hydrolase/transferase, partial [Flavitalea sp.]|nr:sulfatase-like hydrolase/transferase [Flavitalea sp.]
MIKTLIGLDMAGSETFPFTRRCWYSGFTLTLLFACLFNCSLEAQDKPNLIVLLVDDFGYGDISYEGNTQIKTPNIDRIAKEGVRFTRFYQSGAACAPTRAAILTGRYALSAGVWDVHYGRDFLRRDEQTIADAFKEAGYTTGAFGKWHNGKTNSYFSWNRGFDVGLHPKLYQYFDNDAIFNNKLVHYDGPVTDLVGDEVIKFIETHKDQPFFAYVPFQDIHEPFNCPPRLFEKYKAKGYSDHVARLYGMIEAVDDNVGKILDAVNRLELQKETLVVFLGDDGPSPGVDLSYNNRRMNQVEQAERSRAWSRQLRGEKGSLWEGGVITPCYMSWPGHIQPGRDIHQIAGIIDLYPTLLDAFGITTTHQTLPVDGRSLWPLLKGETIPDWDKRFYFDNSNFYQIPIEAIDLESPQIHYLSVQHQQYKMVRQDGRLYGGRDPVKYYLFDLKTDPEEKQDISGQHPEMTQLLKDTLNNWFAGILRSGRAFYQAEYPVGDWQERETPINLDAMSEITGSLRRKSLSLIEGWDRPGNSLKYPID